MNWKSLLRNVGREAVNALDRAIRTRSTTSSGTRSSSDARPGDRSRSTTTPRPAASRPSRPTPAGGEPSPYGAASAREISPAALPQFDYAPHHLDGDADPGEVVWTWVPYEDVPEVGKDRPVLVLAHIEDDLVVVQLTSKDNNGDLDEARHGRYWIDIGSGSWDSRGRPSEVRIDRLLRVGQSAIRREGGVLGEGVFRDVVTAVSDAHARGL